MNKRIQHILEAREKKITEEDTIVQPLPHKDFRFASPFIVLHHMLPKQIEPGQKLRIHPHPHRGFAPVTFQLQGEGYHKDSAGHDMIVKAGDVQWMFAGKGILHSEGPTQEMLDRGGTQEFVQLWINAPAARKWDEPGYQSATRNEQPKILQQDGVDLHLASGNFDGKTGPINTLTPVITICGSIQKEKRVQFNTNSGYWSLLYIISGSVNINHESIEAQNLIVFEKENDDFILCAEQDSKILFLSAEPIDEPVAARDNYVMNTAAELDQAAEDYKNGLFGTLNF